LSNLAADALAVAEHAIYSDAIAVARNPATVPEGTLREVIETDVTGRRISRFIGSPEACWGPFKTLTKFVTAFPGARHTRTTS
jgi:hypothetical protein